MRLILNTIWRIVYRFPFILSAISVLLLSFLIASQGIINTTLILFPFLFFLCIFIDITRFIDKIHQIDYTSSVSQRFKDHCLSIRVNILPFFFDLYTCPPPPPMEALKQSWKIWLEILAFFLIVFVGFPLYDYITYDPNYPCPSLRGRCSSTCTYLFQEARKNNSTAQYFLGYEFLGQSCFPYNPEQALFWLNQSAAQNYPPALSRLGTTLAWGDAGQVDCPGALKAYEALSAIDRDKAEARIGKLLIHGRCLPQNCTAGLEMLNWVAAKEELHAANILGEAYEEGVCVDKDMKNALDWYLKAEKMGNDIYVYNTARLLLERNQTGDREAAMNRLKLKGEFYRPAARLYWTVAGSASK